MELILLFIPSIFLFAETVSGESHAVCQTQPVKVVEGEDALLQCRLDPPVNLSAYTVDFKRVDKPRENVYVYRDRQDHLDAQMDQYRGRTTFHHEDLTRGVLNLTISSVSLSDNTSYECFVPKLKAACVLHVIVEEKRTKTTVSRATGPAVEEVTESDDGGGGNREAGRAVVLLTVVFLLLCVLVGLPVARSRERRIRLTTPQDGSDGDKYQSGAAGDGSLNV